MAKKAVYFPLKKKYAKKATKRATKVGKKRGRQPGSKNKPKEQSVVQNGSIISLLPPRERAKAIAGVLEEMRKEESTILKTYLTSAPTIGAKMAMLGRLEHLANEISTLSLFLKMLKSSKDA